MADTPDTPQSEQQRYFGAQGDPTPDTPQTEQERMMTGTVDLGELTEAVAETVAQIHALAELARSGHEDCDPSECSRLQEIAAILGSGEGGNVVMSQSIDPDTPQSEQLPINAARMPDGSIKYCGVLTDPWNGPEGDVPCALSPGHDGFCDFRA